VLSDEKYMAAVFEEFLRNFYALKQNEFTVGSTELKWQATAQNPDHLQFLPRMRTDLTLSSKDRAIIIDAKYYRDALQEHHSSRKLHSGNLYQLMSYLRAASADSTPGRLIEGALVYPVGEQSIDVQYTIDGHPVRIYTIDLGQPWRAIEAELLEFISPAPSSLRAEEAKPNRI
jgi:5-methylcytosine-specific restriction enzyme subunit McrC